MSLTVSLPLLSLTLSVLKLKFLPLCSVLDSMVFSTA